MVKTQPPTNDFAKMKQTIMLLVVVATILISCDSGKARGQLAKADAMVEHHPDSALAMLRTIGHSDLATEGDEMLYLLIENQAKYKTDAKASAQDLKRCVGYYRKHGDTQLLVRSLYYHGAINNENGGNPRTSILDYKEAEQMLNAETDEYLAYRIYNGLACICSENGDMATSEHYSRKQLEFALATRNKEFLANAFNGMVKTMYALGETDSMAHYADKALALLKDCKAEEKIETYNNLASFYYEQAGDIAKAEKYYMLSLKCKDNDDARFALANINVDNGNIALAKRYAKSLLQSKDKKTVFLALGLLESISAAKQDYRQAYKYKEQSDSLFSQKTFYDNEARTKEILAKYDNEVLKAKEAKERYVYIISLLLGIIVIFCVSSVSIGIIRKKREKIKRLEETLQAFDKQIETLRNDTDKTVKEKLEEYSEIAKEKQEAIDQLGKEIWNAKSYNKKLETERKDIERRTELLFHVMSNKKNILSEKESREQIIESFRNIDGRFVKGIESIDNPRLSTEERVFMVLLRMGKTAENIKKILCLSDDAYRKLKSRAFNKAKKTESMKAFCDKFV